jgi:hypothetical protein
MPHYAVVTTDGVSLGPFELVGSDWQPGSTILTGSSQANLRVVDVLDNDDPERFAILVVEEVGLSLD